MNTPHTSLIGLVEQQTSNTTIEQFLALSDEDCIERLDTDHGANATLHSPTSPPRINVSSLCSRNSTPREATNTLSLGKAPQAQIVAATRRPAASSFRSQDSSNMSVQADVAYACHALAKKLGFDMIYVTEIVPKQPGMSDRDLVAPGGIEKRILGAHGIMKPLDLSSPMHLEVLRTRAGLDYALNSKEYNDEYDIGYLIPLHTELGPLKLRSSGLVVGAYRKSGTRQQW